MARQDFTKDRHRRQLQQRGHEDVRGGMLLPGNPRPKPSKQQLRMDLDAALASVVQIKRVLRCDGCSHQFVRLQPLYPPFPHQPCPRCGGAV